MPLKTYENIVLDVLRKTSGVTSICLKSSTALDILVGTTDATVRFSLDRNELFASIRRLKDVEKCKIPEIGIDHIIRFRGGTPHHGTILDASDIQEQVYRLRKYLMIPWRVGSGMGIPASSALFSAINCQPSWLVSPGSPGM